MTRGIAYRSEAAEVLTAWADYQAARVEGIAKRRAMSERYGRGLMVNRLGFGHGTRVVGFEILEGEEDGLLIGDNSEIRIPLRGPPYNTATPNLRRKAGKELAAELRTLDEEGPSLPGMPDWQLVGLRALSPALFEHDGAIWAYWGEDVSSAKSGGEIDASLWEDRPLSAYYAVVEQREQAAS